MKNFNRLLPALTLVALLGSAPSLRAEETATHTECREEIRKLCPQNGPKSGLGKCIREHREDLSPQCRAKVKAARKKMKSFMKDCKADVKKLCEGVKRGEGRIVDCLTSHESELSPACKARFEDGLNLTQDSVQ